MIRIFSALSAASVVLFAACDSGSVDLADARAVTSDGVVSATNGDDRELAKLAVETLAEHLNVPVNTISVDTIRTVDWRDSSIGCPQPDQAYLQVITPGHKITLRHDGAFHFVHEANGNAFVCVRQKSADGFPQTVALEWGPQAVAARTDLAGKLGVAADKIIIGNVEGTTFSDGSLACPEPGVDYEQGDRPGYVITLRHGSRDYTYHADNDRAVACPSISDE